MNHLSNKINKDLINIVGSYLLPLHFSYRNYNLVNYNIKQLIFVNFEDGCK